MKFLRRIMSVGLTAALLAGSVTFTAPKYEKASAAPDEYHDDWLHVNENAEIVDMYGNPVWLTGCNWFGYNVTTQCFDGVWSLNMHDALNQIADHGFNLLRVPMSTQILLQWKYNEPDPYMVKINTYSNPELSVEGVEGGTPKYSFDIWNMAVDWCRENGIKIMMDIHCATTASNGHQLPLWYDSNYSTDDWLEALSWFAEYYKDDDTVIAIDLKNEPHGKNDGQGMAIWDGSTAENNWRYAAERGAAACLEQNPNLLIMVEGIEVYPKFENGKDWNSPAVDYAHYDDPNAQAFHGAWWGGNFRGARDYPVDLGEHQSQLVYSPHDYGPLVWEQEWFKKDFTRQTLLDDYWYNTWAFLVEEKISPLLMGEWGGFLDAEHDPTGDNRKWMGILRDYMIEKRIHHTFWCFNENSGDTGGLIAGGTNWTEWDQEKYEFVEPSLWQNEDGKYISLDHKIPLGKSGNGISLSDHYNGSSNPNTTTTTKTTTITSTTSTTTTNVTTTVNGTINDVVPDYGDANVDGTVNLADAVLIMQVKANPNKYSLTERGERNSDCSGNGDGVTNRDALAIQKYLLGLLERLPE
ncbi:MAG: cellulase family glycosylhydrolase [Ruminococcus sp.]|nr:cellulase family glycosylhydrolase [Ruminococcus sp.]